ncbi:hypothetical protein HUT19_01825 [Streptomyces sp. NA02950]|uniref:hypothetical protein n=1 Tax=Streptomyces sp. NA02950 TaxID=2742137 RepID=UPI001591AC5B|nr:hypothetical protein [Streptomyces sp. NA02950]QKV90651.1 hypothetical protein HUT19_01825 [Streptomyces sp. NA02950]
MKSGIGIVVASAASLAVLLGGTGTATAQDSGTGGKSCDGVRLTGDLPAPSAGRAVSRQITIGPDCKATLGPVRHTAASPAARRAAAPAAAGAGHQLRGWNEMYDCCNIRMTGLYTTAAWDTTDQRITEATITPTQEWNREPWDAGWSLASRTSKDDCTADCPVVNSQAHADFTYKGIFDPIGSWYANTHHSTVRLNADGTSSCHFDVELRHTFVGWNWRYGCE